MSPQEKERRKKYRQRPEVKKKNIENQTAYYNKNKGNPVFMERQREIKRQYFQRLRRIVLGHYGAFCRCCGEKEDKFLCIDHKDNGRGNPAKRNPNPMLWIIQNNFPPYFQVLCHNCNLAKGFYGKCPHEK